jgi:asparagine synthase (glutamine-hydrolysing)
LPDKEFLDLLDVELRAAVEARLISDVPLGCFLSGGIDSSLVVAYARKIHGPGLKTFTVSFPGTKRDEASFAKIVADKLGTDHHQIDLHSSDMETQYVETLRKCPEPLGDDSFLPTYFISRATREYVTVAISGDGGDELFGGYPKYHQILSARRFHPLFRFLPQGLLAFLPDKFAKAAGVFRLPDDCARALWLSSLWKEDELAAVLQNPDSADAGQSFFRSEWEKHLGQSLQERFSLTDIATYLEGSILMKVDRASMAASLEVRAPLLDERILDLTVATGVRNGPLGNRKAALRALLSRHLPLELFAGPKRGFGLPIDEWFRGSLRGILMEYTSESRLREGGLVDPRRVAGIRDMHLSGQRNFGRKLHALVAWEIWREQAGL